MKQLCDHCTRINGGKSCLHLGDTNKIKHDGYQRLMTLKCLILQIFFLNFVHHFGFPWCTFDLKTLLVLFDGNCRRCFTCSCMLHTGNNTGKYVGSVGTNSTCSFVPEAWFMVAAGSGKSQGYKNFLKVREYTSLKEVWQNLKLLSCILIGPFMIMLRLQKLRDIYAQLLMKVLIRNSGCKHI